MPRKFTRSPALRSRLTALSSRQLSSWLVRERPATTSFKKLNKQTFHVRRSAIVSVSLYSILLFRLASLSGCMKRYATLTAGFFLTSFQQYHTSFMNVAVSQLHYTNDKCVFKCRTTTKILNIIYVYIEISPVQNVILIAMHPFMALLHGTKWKVTVRRESSGIMPGYSVSIKSLLYAMHTFRTHSVIMKIAQKTYTNLLYEMLPFDECTRCFARLGCA